MSWRMGVCGLNCALCDIYHANHGDDTGRLEIQKWFKERRHEDVPLEKIGCDGCRCPPERNWSEDCPMQICATKRGILYCFECRDFPCEHLRKFASEGTPHHKKSVENLAEMRRLGIDEWIKHQKKPIFCP